MVRQALVDQTGLLLEWGLSDYGGKGIVVAPDFAFAPGTVRWNGATWVPVPQTDPRAFELALHDVFSGADQATLNTLASKFPLFLWSLKIDHNWPAVEAIVKAALGSAIITQPQYDAIKAAAATNTVPVNL